jgi:hypothetical protein
VDALPAGRTFPKEADDPADDRLDAYILANRMPSSSEPTSGLPPMRAEGPNMDQAKDCPPARPSHPMRWDSRLNRGVSVGVIDGEPGRRDAQG